MKVVLVSLAIGEKYLNIYNILFRKSHEDYAKLHGYDFKVITDFLDTNYTSNKSITFHKFLLCNQEWSNDYDFIIYVDADILINIKSPSIHDFIDYEGLIGVVDEYTQPTKEARLKIQQKMNWEVTAKEYYKLCDFDIDTEMVLNGGMFVMQPKLHNNFLLNIYDKYVAQSSTHFRDFHWEQSCFGYELQKNNYYKVLDNKFNAVWWMEKIDNPYNNLQTYFNNNYFIHFAGHVDYDKIQFLNKS